MYGRWFGMFVSDNGKRQSTKREPAFPLLVFHYGICGSGMQWDDEYPNVETLVYSKTFPGPQRLLDSSLNHLLDRFQRLPRRGHTRHQIQHIPQHPRMDDRVRDVSPGQKLITQACSSSRRIAYYNMSA